MRRREFLWQLGSWGSAAGMISLSGCGTILHHERVGQPHSRDVDWKIAGLNGLGLACFFVPGVIAFVVDFYTGAIYLPPEYLESYSENSVAPPPEVPVLQEPMAATDRAVETPNWQGAQTGELRRVMVPQHQLRPAQIEEVVSSQTGRQISLLDANTRVSQLPQLDQFAQQRVRHSRDARFGQTVGAFFAQLLPS